MSIEQFLAVAQADVEKSRDRLAAATSARAHLVHKAHAEGVTIYRIAKILGVSQPAVRKMLGL